MSGAYSTELSVEQQYTADLQHEAASFRAGGRAWAFVTGTILGVEIAAGESFVKTVALTAIAAAGAFYSNERRTHLEDEIGMPQPDARQQG